MNLADLDGLITPETGEALRALAADCPPGTVVVEVGSFKGKSTAYLAAGAAEAGTTVTAVDPWDLQPSPGKHGFNAPSVRERFDEQLRAVGHRDRVTAVRGYSTEVAAAWDGPPIGVLYIDGDHRYESVAADIAAWEPHLAPGAVVVFDDYRNPNDPGVPLAVDGWAGSLGARVEVAADWLAVVWLP